MINNVVNIGYGNMVMASKVVAVLSPDSAPMRRLKEEAKERKMLIDATQGRKTRAIIITDSDHIILSAVQVETVAARLGASEGAPEPEEMEPLVTPAADISIHDVAGLRPPGGVTPLKKSTPGTSRKGG